VTEPIDLAEIVEAAAPHLPEALVSKSNHAAIAAAVGRLPSLVSRGGGFECRLGASSRGADFYFSPSRERDRPEGLSPALLESDVWRRLRTFWEAWSSPGSAIHTRVADDLWLELDVEGPERVPVPLVFFAPAKDAASPPADVARWAMEDALPILGGEAVPDRVKSAVQSCLAALPEGARIGYVGSLRARGASAVRLCISDFPAAEIPSYLGRVGGPDVPALADFADVLPRVTLDIDVEEAVAPAVGVEYDFFSEVPRGGRVPRYATLLERAVAVSACLPEKRDAVLAWPGVAPHRFSAGSWEQSGGGIRLSTVLVRRLSHVKLSCAPGRPLEAKAYLACWIGAAS
jgi:hypothetical protein